jgi:lantibiotic modifying enzyme
VLFEPGLGVGLGGTSVLYSFVRCGQFLQEETLLEDARRIADMINRERIAGDAKLDLLGGSAGAILGLLVFHSVTGEQDLLDKAEMCGQHLLRTRLRSASGFRAWPTLNGQLVTGFSHGAAGIAYALTRLYRATGLEDFREAALEGCAYERDLYDAESGNWPDFRYPATAGKPVFQCSWCHGAPGIALGRLAMLEMLEGTELREDLDRALQTTMRNSVSNLDHLCCGTMGIASILFTAGRSLADAKYTKAARRVAGFVLRRARRDSQYSLGWGHGPYLPSFQQGMSGIGYQFLRMAHPDALPDVLRWN